MSSGRGSGSSATVSGFRLLPPQPQVQALLLGESGLRLFWNNLRFPALVAPPSFCPFPVPRGFSVSLISASVLFGGRLRLFRRRFWPKGSWLLSLQGFLLYSRVLAFFGWRRNWCGLEGLPCLVEAKVLRDFRRIPLGTQ